MKKWVTISLCLAMLAAQSCTDPKTKAVNQLNNLYEDISANAQYYTDEDWENFIREYAYNDSIIASYEYSKEELNDIHHIQGRCAAIILQYQVKKGGEKAMDYLDDINSFVNGFLDEFSK